MPKNHAKAIKGMSIACIVLSGLAILVAIAMIFMLGFLDSVVANYSDPYSYYDMSDYYDSIFGAYGLGSSAIGLDGTHGAHHGAAAYGYYDYSDYYSDYASYKLAASVASIMAVCCIIGAAITLAASIIILKNHNKPEKFGMVFVWSIVGAVLALLSGTIVAMVLFIIIAVFINSDKKLYQAGMYFAPAPGAVPGYPMQQPGVPGAPIAPVAPVPPAGPVAPAPAAPAATVPVQPIQPASEPATQVTTAEIHQPAVQPALVPGETQPPAPAEAATPAAAAAAPATDPAAPIDAAVETVQAEAVVEAPVETPAPVVVDEGAVIKLDISGEQPPEQ